ncbi:MAG: dipeptide/oligopeptide/nickel ABC transporter ATP-binding protein [Gemmatimonadota bacterium]
MNGLPSKPPLLEGRRLSKGYPLPGPRLLARGRLSALNQVDVALRAGECMAVVGPSGAGKSTLARILGGLEAPDSGQLLFQGKPVRTQDRAEQRHFRRAIQLVFQDPFGSLTPRLRVGAALDEILKVHFAAWPGPERVARREELFASVGLGLEISLRFPHELSGGQRQRVALARALAVGPRALILDEPTSALDTPIRAQIVSLLREIQERDKLAILLVTHDLALVGLLAERVMVLERGAVVDCGSPDVVLGGALRGRP